MAGVGDQVAAVERLVLDSVRAIDSFAPAVLGEVMPVLRAARDELRRDLGQWLAATPGGSERFTAYQRAQTLRSLEASLERVAQLEPAMGRALEAGRELTGPLAVANLDGEIRRLSAIFGGGVPKIPQIKTAAIIARGERMLWRRHATSARRYAGQVGDDIRHLFAVGLAKGETFEQLVTRLRRLGNPRARSGPIDPGADADTIAGGLFQRYKHTADRLVRTEIMHAYNVQHDESIAYANEHRPDGDDPYLRRWDATADKVACPRCKALHGTVSTLDGTFRGGIKSPPAHPYCRCILLAWMARWGDMRGEERIRGRIPKEHPHRPKGPVKDRGKSKPEPVAAPPKPPTTDEVIAKLPTIGRQEGAILDAVKAGDLEGAKHRIQDLIAARGHHPSEIPAGMTPSRRLVVSDDGMVTVDHSGRPIKADAFHKWDGETRLSVTSAADLKRLASSTGKTLAAEAAVHTKEAEALIAQADALSASARSTAARKRLRPQISAFHEQARGPRGRALDVRMGTGGLHILVHEEVHGFSPVRMRAYKFAGGKIEEVTTETVARVVMRDRFGAEMATWSHGAYSSDITATTKAISEAAGSTMNEAWATLQNASERFRRRATKIGTADEVMEAFAKDVAEELGARSSHVERYLRIHLGPTF